MIGDAIAGALGDLREQAESLMRSIVTVTRVTGTTRDADDRDVPATTVVYRGKARVMRTALSVATVDAAGRPVTVQRPPLAFPVAAYAMQVGDVATIVANPDDPSLVGHRYRITAEAPTGSIAVEYRVAAEEVI